MYKKVAIALFGLATVFLLLFGHSFLPFVWDWFKRPTLVWQIEGSIKDANFRDLGQSINSCLKKQGLPDIFQDNLVYRANRFFSGWSCNSVGNPQQIFTLNFVPEQNHEYFCRTDSGEILVGKRENQDFEISDIENLQNWQDERFRSSLCGFFTDILTSIAGQQRTLVHCDAGRDRTGTMSAMIVQSLFEASPLSQTISADKITTAIECDYQKSESLDPSKYGRMQQLINQLKTTGGTKAFLQNTCNIPDELLAQASKQFLKFDSAHETSAE